MPGKNTPKESPQSLFKPFSWHQNPDYTFDERLAENAVDIANGIELALQMIESDELAPNIGNLPMLDPANHSVLMRFVIASARLLGESAERNIEFRNENRRNKGGAA